MQSFSVLYTALDDTTKTNEKLRRLREFFAAARPADSAWAVYFLCGNRPKRLIPAARLRTWAAEAAGIPGWLFEESYQAVGDLAETIALLLPDNVDAFDVSLAECVEQHLLPLGQMGEEDQRQALRRLWMKMGRQQRFVFCKLITGSFRVGVSRRLVTRALGDVSNVSPQVVAHRLMGEWRPTAEAFSALIAAHQGEIEISRPYPFCLAYPLENGVRQLGRVADWQAEWKWDGIRGQLIRRAGETFLWSRGEDLVNEQFPEITAAAGDLPDGVVLDGEILAWLGNQPLAFGQLQKRLGRRRLGRKILAEVPVVFVAFDVMEWDGKDIRAHPLEERRSHLRQLLTQLPQGAIRPSRAIPACSWDELSKLRGTSRQRHTEGLMLKKHNSPYHVGRVRGDWWKWKIDPYCVDAVLIYAQAGHGRRASLFTDYTFGVWDGDRLVPFAKAYSGLTDAEISEVDRFVRANTLERYGPVRGVAPELVFELAFENIQRSTRHKSGIAVRFPRIARWRRDKPPRDADSLQTILAMLPRDSVPEP